MSKNVGEIQYVLLLHMYLGCILEKICHIKLKKEHY